MTRKLIEITLFGACTVKSVASGKPAASGGYELTGAKHKALIALLVSAPFGKRSRSFLQETLWGVASYDTGRQSLRRALADIKHIMGDDFSALLTSTNSDVSIDLQAVKFTGHAGRGTFLEGLDLRETGFNQWLCAIRQNPGQLESLARMPGGAQLQSILPVVAVLPFRAISNEAGDSVLGDWLAEEACRSLSRSRLLAVISHLSSREFAQGTFDLSGVRARLGADFCVSGSLRRVSEQLILDVDFVDVASSRILWTRQFIHKADQYYALSVEGVANIVQSIGAAIADEAMTHIAGRELEDIDNHRLVIAGVNLMHQSTLREFARSKVLLEEALNRAQNVPEVHAWLGKWHVLNVFNGWSADTAHETQLALDCTARALDISPDNAFSLTIDGFAQNNLLKRLDLAERRYDAALAHNPNEALCWALKGTLHAFRDEGKAAVEATQRARRLSPVDPFGYFYDTLSATTYFADEDFASALAYAGRSIAQNDRHMSTLRIKIAALHFLGRRAEAKDAATDLMRKQPEFTVASYLGSHPAADFKVGKNVAKALLAAGIP